MSANKLVLISLAIAYVEARFGQEGLVQASISALDAFGEPGVAATLAGQTAGVLLGGAGPCDKLALADDIVAQLGDDPEVIAGAASLVAAEKNFNNFEADTGTLCGDPELPATEALRGILPLFDPDVEGADVQNENSAASLETAFDATGLSEAEVAIEQGFTNFIAQDAAGAEVALAGLDAGGVAAADDAAADDAAADDAAGDDAAADDAAADDAAADDAAADDAAADDAAGDDAAGDAATDAAGDEATETADDAEATETAEADQNEDDQAQNGNGQDDQGQDAEATETATETADDAEATETATETADDAEATETDAAGQDNENQGNENNGDDAAADEDQNDNNQDDNNQDNGDDAAADEDQNADNQDAEDDAAAGGGAADFGDCDPTIIFEGGLGGRPADEFTFQSADAAIAANQQEALNPDIIVNRICDELGNTCGANDAAIQACTDAQQDLVDQGLGVGSDGEEVLTAFNDAILAA